MNDKKTTRKNNTNLTIKWPSNDEYFTITSLIEQNPHMLTSSGSDITLRVRLRKAIDENLVTEIGYKNVGKGRPTLAFSMTPVNPSVLLKADKDGICLKSQKVVTVAAVNSNKTLPIVTNITNIIPSTAKV